MAVELANPAAALRTYLRECTPLVTLVGTAQRIIVEWPDDKDNPFNVPPYINLVVIMPGRGGRGELGLGQQETRMDIFCYGERRVVANQIWRTLDFYLNPIGVRRRTSFTRNNCQVNSIIREGGDIRLTDPDSADWPYTLGTYILNYNGQVRS